MTRDSDDDAFAARFRAGLEQELGGVSADRRMLAEVLATPVRRRTWRLRPATGAVIAVLGVAAIAVAPVVVHLPTRSPASTHQVTPPAASGAPSPTPTPPPVSPSPTSTGSPSASSAAARCPAQTSDPGGATVSVDLDGDGVADTLTYNGGALHVVLGAGRGQVDSPFTTASPYVTALPVSTAGTARRQVLLGTRGAISPQGAVGVVARLYDLRDCVFAPVLGVNGRPYDFLVGGQSATERRGVVCEGGVLYGRTSVLRGGAWQVTDTPVTSTSGTAVNGTPRTSTVPDGTPAAQALSTETCGGPPQTLD